MKKKQVFAALVAIVLLLSNAKSLTVSAGSSELVVGEASYETEISSALWNNLDEDVYVKDGKLIFPDNSTETTTLITKTNAKINEKCENVVSAQATIAFNKLPKGETFTFALGLGSVESTMGEAGSVEIQFSNSGTVKAQLVVYDLDGSMLRF